ncbi:MAG: hypothetical protein LC785_01925 [Acidobacteria bacterium]|nr:hypothetical protein [Acidobacteriota bacterium]MCA1640744.1 hypothetical protein [Acidobacteriota bacterium]
MKLKIFVAVLAVAIAWFAGRQFYRVAGQNEVAGGDAQTVAEQIKAGEQTVNASQTLDAGARVEVSGINGPVDIMTTEGNVAEIHIENSVSDARDLDAHKITIDRAADRLVVRGENKNGGGLGLLRWLIGRGGSSTTVRQRVVLKVPRRVEVVARGINGALRVGELEGAVRVSGINGEVTVARAAGRADFSGINGNVTFAVAHIEDAGVRVSGVNGNIELRLDREVNADVRVGGLNGSVDYDLKNVTVEDGGENHSRFVARIGAGGAPIRMSGISGNIRLAGA